ncbi:MAG: mannose-1-phosphate guanylyltransferase/mannose-6-phosphate isomerase [Burkholderiales bacterium]|nr:mannose-1-phosphate guanylyltransferase/mannose-6-phosphate isomerase [Burkholderiales bacterium]
MTPITPVLLCGGSGQRLWPLSRGEFPKQFHAVVGGDTLLQAAAARLARCAGDGMPVTAPIVVTAEAYRFLVVDQLHDAGIEPAQVLLEPAGRGTAAALTLAALAAGDDAILVATPADHVVADPRAFADAVRSAVRRATGGAIVVLGVVPDRPETGYGYIFHDGDDVLRFVEKPDAPAARRYLEAGNCCWNAGIVAVRASVWLAAAAHFCADIAEGTAAAWRQRSTDGVFTRPGREAFLAVRSDSFDYAVLERCPGSPFPIGMVKLQAGWSDLGAWDAVWQALPKDDAGNAGAGDVLVAGSRNTLAHASSRLVAVVGVDDLVVVETADAVLVARRDCSQDVRDLVESLARQQRPEQQAHRRSHRPWGWYEVIDQGERFKVKRICVKPGASLSLQVHTQRAEHWVVVRGTAEVTCEGRVQLVAENQSTYIAAGHAHRLANPGAAPLEIIEVQSGSYLGEDDIVRLEDRYGRSP